MPTAGGAGFADWQELAQAWERGRALLWESTRPVSEWLVEALAPEPGQTLLELAAGSGDTGLLAAGRIEPGGKLISSDRSPNMVEAARRLAAELGAANVEFRVLDSDSLELPDASVDGVLSRFGYVLKGDPPRALAEIRRVLRPGGAFAFAVWAERSRNAWMTVPAQALVDHGLSAGPSAEDVRVSERRNPGAIRGLLDEAGFAVSRIEEMAVSYRFADGEELWRFVSELRGPLSLAIGRLDSDAAAAVRTTIERGAERTVEGGFELGGVSLNVLAR
jgi:SAM-dependent methyltransferase